MFSTTFSKFYQTYLIAQNKFNNDQKNLILDKAGLRSVLDNIKEGVNQQLISKIQKMQPTQSLDTIKDWIRHNFKEAFAQYSGSKESFDRFFTEILDKLTNIQPVDKKTSKIQKGLTSYNSLDDNQKRFIIPTLMSLNETIIAKDNTSALALKNSLADLSNFLIGGGPLPITFKFCANDKLNAIDYFNKLIKLFMGTATSGCAGFNINKDVLNSINGTYLKDVKAILDNVMLQNKDSSQNDLSLPAPNISSIDYKIFGLSDPTLVLPKNLYIKNYLEICEMISGLISAGSPLITILTNYISQYGKYCKNCSSSYDKMMGLGFAQTIAEFGSFIGVEKAFHNLESSVKRFIKDQANKPVETKPTDPAKPTKPNIANDSKLSGEQSGLKAGTESAGDFINEDTIRAAAKAASNAATDSTLGFTDARFAQAATKGFEDPAQSALPSLRNYLKGGLDREAVSSMTTTAETQAQEAAYDSLISSGVPPAKATQIAESISKKAADAAVKNTQKLVRAMNKAATDISKAASEALPGQADLAKAISDAAQNAATKEAAAGGTKEEIKKAAKKAAKDAADKWKAENPKVKVDNAKLSTAEDSVADTAGNETANVTVGDAQAASSVTPAPEAPAPVTPNTPVTEPAPGVPQTLEPGTDPLSSPVTPTPVTPAPANNALQEAADAGSDAATEAATEAAADAATEVAVEAAAESNPITGAVMAVYMIGSTVCGAAVGAKAPDDAKYCDPIGMAISADTHLCSKEEDALGGGSQASTGSYYAAKAITYATNPSCFALDTLSNVMTNVIAKAPDAIGGFFASVCNVGMDVVQGNMQGAGEESGQMAENYNGATLEANLVTSVSPYAKAVIPNGTWANSSQSSSSFCSGVGAWISGAISTIVSGIATAVGDIIGGIGTFLTGGYDQDINNLVHGAYNEAIDNAFENAFSSATWANIGQSIKTFFTTDSGHPGEFCTDWLQRYKNECRGCSTGEVVEWSARGGSCPFPYVLNYGCGCGCMKFGHVHCPDCNCDD